MSNKNRPNPALNQLTRANSLDWKTLNEPGIEGVMVKSLRFDKDENRSPTILLKFLPETSYPTHTHPGGEEIYVIEGSVKIGADMLFVGDYLYTAPNNVHAVYSKEGCVLIVNVPQEVIIIDMNKQQT